MNPLIPINYIWSFEKVFSKIICEIYIKDRSVTVKSITLQHFQFKRFQGEKNGIFTLPPRRRTKSSPRPINLNKDILY